MEATDAELVRRYAQKGSQEAFRELVHRHLSLVYAVAWRHLHSSSLAADVTQSVFTDLARTAAALSPAQPLVAWLHVVARRTALDCRRAEQRRQAREQTAAELAVMNAPSSDWNRLEPLLDELLAELSADDRHVLLLRFFDNRRLREVGEILGTSDDAAQKRVGRALEQLREAFARRGLVVGTTALTASVSANALVPVPVGVVAALATASFTDAAASSVAASALGKTLIVTTVVLAAGLVWQTQTLSVAQQRVVALDIAASELEPAWRTAQADRDRAVQTLTVAEQRMAATQARTAEEDATEAALEAWLGRVTQIREWLERTPARRIPEMDYLQANDWLLATRDNPLKTEMQLRRCAQELRRLAKFKPEISHNLSNALKTYIREHPGQEPDNVDALRPYLEPTLSPEILDRYEFATPSWPGARAGQRVLLERTPADEDFDVQIYFQFNGGSGNRGISRLGFALRDAHQAFARARPNEQPARPEDLLPFLPPEIDAATFREYWNDRNFPFRGQ